MADPRRLHRLPVLVLLAAGLGAGAACSGSGSGGANGVASIQTAAGKTASDHPAEKDKAKTSPEDAALAFARCMREHGVDMPDPDTGGGGGVVKFGATSAAGQKIDPEMNKFSD